MKKANAIAAVLFMLSLPALMSAKEITINIWEQHEPAQTAVFDAQAADFMAQNPGIKIVRTHYGTEDLRSQYQTASLAGKGPELVMGPSDNIGPFSTAEMIIPLDTLMGADFFKKFTPSAVDSVKLGGKIWGLPILMGNTLSLLYNKSLIKTPPKKFSEIIAFSKKFNDGKRFGLAYNEAEAFWFVTFLGGFGGSVFAPDGVTPTLNTPQMIKALQFVQDLKFKDKILPEKSDYNVADSLFKSGQAAMIINGPWSFAGYQESLKDNFGIAVLPVIDATGKPMLAYSAAKSISVNANIKDKDTLDAVKKFLTFLSGENFEIAYAEIAKESPAVAAYASNKKIMSDPFIVAVVNQVKNSVPMPTVAEMRAIWDSMGPELIKIMANSETPEEAAKNMQDAAVKKISEMK